MAFAKTKVARRRKSWRKMDEVDIETLKRVGWFSQHVLLEPIGNILPAEPEVAFDANLPTLDKGA